MVFYTFFDDTKVHIIRNTNNGQKRVKMVNSGIGK